MKISLYVLFCAFFFIQLHCMEVCDSQINPEYSDNEGIAIFYATLNGISDLKKQAYLCDVQKRHVGTNEDKEISPRSTKNVLRNNVLSNNDKYKNVSPGIPLKNFRVKSKDDISSPNKIKK